MLPGVDEDVKMQVREETDRIKWRDYGSTLKNIEGHINL